VSRFVVKATRPDGRTSWLAQSTRHLARHLGPRDSAATFDTEDEAQAELDCAANGYAIVGITLAIEPAE
jgi:hypothetical protein